MEAIFTKGVEVINISGLMQWDVGQEVKISFPSMPATFQVHFGHKKAKEAYAVEAITQNGSATVQIPNILLQQPHDIIAWVYVSSGMCCETTHIINFDVEARPRPSDYAYKETDILNYATVVEKSQEIAAIAARAEVAEACNETLNSAKSYTDTEIAVERERINALTTLKEGSTTGDAELIDARIDKNGNTHANVGEHIRNVTSQLSSEIDDINKIRKYVFTVGTNLINPNDMIVDHFINIKGEVEHVDANSKKFKVTGFIPVYKSNIVGTWHGYNLSEGDSSILGVGVYDAHFRYIRGLKCVNKYEYVEGDSYIRCCFSSDILQANYGNGLLPFEEYKEINLYEHVEKNSKVSQETYNRLYEAITPLDENENLVDINRVSIGKYFDWNNGMIVNAPDIYSLSDYIPVNKRNMVGNWILSENIYCIIVYDKAFNFLRVIKNEREYIYVEGDYYIRAEFNTNTPIINYGNTLRSYKSYRNRIDILEEDFLKDYYINSFIKDVLVIGDSTSEGLVSDYPYIRLRDKRWSWTTYLSQRNNWNITNEALAGTNAIDWLNNNYQSNSYKNYQLVIIDYGYNGTIENTLSTDVLPYSDYNEYADSQCGNYCKLIALLKTENPNLIIMPIIQAGASGTNINTIKAICEHFDLDYIDLTDTDLNDSVYHGYYSLENMQNNVVDMVHFNLLGYVRKAYWMEKKILSNLIKDASKTNQMIGKQQQAIYSEPI